MINSADELRAWLNGKPADWAQIIVVRVAMRALPYLGREGQDWLRRFAQMPIRAIAISWAARNVPAHDMAIAAAAATATADAIAATTAATARAGAAVAASADAVAATAAATARAAAAVAAARAEVTAADANDATAALATAKATAAAARSATATTDAAIVAATATATAYAAAYAAASADAAVVAADAAVAIAANADGSVWQFVRADCIWLDDHASERSVARSLSRRSLFQDQPDGAWHQAWTNLAEKLLEIDPNYSVWIEWFERRIRGERAAFAIPGDKRRVEDKKILRRLAEATNEDFWDKGHEYVNAALKGWLDEARARVAPQAASEASAKTRDQIAEALRDHASPQARITDGKLDAGPNTVFDKPRYSDHLADLPSELRALTSAILASLPPNCGPVVRNCFHGFQEELEVRGPRPILNILKAMVSSLTAEIYEAAPSEVSPDDWQLRDAREWGPGMASLFASFFKGYHDLIHHFPMDAEREALIAATPIDETAASGAALTAPVDKVAELIVGLGRQGFATDNIVRLVEAHRLYNRDVAQLPTPEKPTEAVTPKRRHVLMTAGFYKDSLAVLANAAKLADSPAVAALIVQLTDAVSKLMAFVL